MARPRSPPHVVVTPAGKAMEFYRDVFGAQIADVTRMPGSDLVAHAVLDFGTGMLTLSDPMEGDGLVAGDRERRGTWRHHPRASRDVRLRRPFRVDS